jgi:hypothetical protein
MAAQDPEAEIRAADEYTGLVILACLALLSPMRLWASRAEHRRAAVRLAGVVERVAMWAFLALLAVLALHWATGFDPLRWFAPG